MRELLARQLALLDEMAARLDAAGSARQRLLGTLRALWRAVDALSRGPSDPEAARRLRAVAEEAHAVLTRPADAPTADATATRPR
jgi:hypothetical protein